MRAAESATIGLALWRFWNKSARHSARISGGGGAKKTMLRLKLWQREILADKVSDLANIGAGLFVFGQFVGQQPWSPPLLVSGVAIWAALVAFALVVGGEKE